MALIDNVKVSLRLKTNAFDTDELEPLILACKKDLVLAGVNVIDDTDPLILRAVILYIKANFGSNPDSEKYYNSYTLLKNSLALAGDYNTVTEVVSP